MRVKIADLEVTCICVYFYWLMTARMTFCKSLMYLAHLAGAIPSQNCLVPHTNSSSYLKASQRGGENTSVHAKAFRWDLNRRIQQL